MKVTIGIPTYNRKEILEIMSKSLYASNLLGICNIRVYDDCSQQYTKDYLNNLFPTAVSIVVNPTNYKADKNMFEMYKDFLSTEDDIFFNADSDIIFNKHWLKTGLDLLEQTDGVLSIFNANSHPILTEISNTISVKKSIGAAGTFFKREKVVEIVNYFENAKTFKSFDWQWSALLTSKNVRLFCTNNSLIQHIGYSGQNSKAYFDVGLGFKVDSLEHGQIINNTMVNSISKVRALSVEQHFENEKKHAQMNNNFSYHFMRCLKIVVKFLLPKKIITLIKRVY